MGNQGWVGRPQLSLGVLLTLVEAVKSVLVSEHCHCIVCFFFDTFKVFVL